MLTHICSASSAAEPEIRVEMAGSLSFPDEAAGPDGSTERITGLSGLTWLRETSWATVTCPP